MDQVKVYEPNKEIKQGLGSVFKAMVYDLIAGRELGFILFKRDFFSRYRQSLLGLLWTILMPLFTVSVFFVLNQSGVINVGETGIPYVVYALFGLTVWNLFTSLITNLTATISSVGPLVSKINFTRISLVFSPLLTSFVDFFVRVVLLSFVMMITHTAPNFKFLPLAIIALLPLVFAAVGFGMIYAVISTLLKDLPNFISVGLSFLMYMSPVLYNLSDRGHLIGIIAKFNPLTYLLNFPRNVLFFGDYSNYETYLFMSSMCFVIFLAGWRFFHVAVSRIVERI